MSTTTAVTKTFKPSRLVRHVPSVSTLLAGAVLVFLVVAATFPTIWAPGDPTTIDPSKALQPPSWGNIFGTDSNGRDLYTRVVHGTRESMFIGLGAASLAMLIAIVVGGGAALGGKVADRLLGGLIEVNLAFPTVLLALLVMAIVGPSKATLIFAVGVGAAPGYARMVRGQVLSVRQDAYIEAARALGHSRSRITLQHVVPNALRPLIAIFALGVGQAIVWASGLAFLGLGVPPPSPEWGALLEAGRIYITSAWWLEVVPGVAIAVTAVSITVLSRNIQSHLEGGKK